MARIFNNDEVVDYEEFLNYLNAINSNSNVSLGDDSGLLQEDIVTSLIAAGIDPDYWFHHIFNQSLLNQTSDYENQSGIGSIWEEGIMVQVPLYTMIFLLGIAGNGLVILTILQNSRMKTVTNLFLLSLAISDLLLGVFCIPFTLVGAILHDFVFGAVFCKLIPYLQAVSVSVSGWILVAISIERFYAIRHPYTSRRWQTRSHARRIILSVWFGSLTVMSPVAILSELKPAGRDGRRKCREVWPNELLEKTFAVFLDVFLLIIPLLLMTFMYALIVNHLWKKDGERGAEQMETTKCSQKMEPAALATLNNSMAADENPSHNITLTVTQNRRSATPSPAISETNLRRCNPEQGLRTKRHVLKMLIVVVLEFFICWTPLYVVNTLSYFAPKALYEGLGYTGISLVQLLAQASCCCNPITYCFMSSSFRKAFFQAFKRSKGVNHQASGLATRSIDPRQPSIHHPHQLDSCL